MRKPRQRDAFLNIVILLCLIFSTSAQENNSFQNIVDSLNIYTNNNAPEKVYIQTDKDFYISGETIWFKAYLLNGITHTASNISNVVYVELVDSKDKIIVQQKLYMESSGVFSDITLPKEIEEDTYILRAYTKYMLNETEPIFFQKEIPVSSSQNVSNKEFNKNLKKKIRNNKREKQKITALETIKPIVQFFPEGGDLVTGIECVLGAKITDSEGNGLALEGKILDDNGLVVSYFNSYEFGLGWTSINVKPNTKYHLQIPIDDKMMTYPIPPALLKGYTLRIMNWGEYINITASTNITNGLEGALLIGHIRGDVVFKQVLKSNDKNYNVIKLYTSKLQDGVAHFTLFAPNGEPVCERLTFVENPKNNLKLSLTTDKPNYGLREKVNVDFTLVDEKEKPLKGDFSMSVFTQNDMQEGIDNIKSWLLLNSDFGGTISNPNFFFQKEKGRNYLLDLLMLTHGWRRFTWKSLMDENAPKTTSFPPEKGIMINGTTTAFKNKQEHRKAQVTLNIVTKELIQEQKLTNAQGKFSFGPFIFEDSLRTVINANSIPISKKNKDRLSIHLDPNYPEVKVKKTRRTSFTHTKKIISAFKKPYPSVIERNITPDFEYDPKVNKLEEVLVKARKKLTPLELLTKKLNARTIYGYPSTRLIPDSIPGLGNGPVNALNALRYAPSVMVRGTFPNQKVFIRPRYGEYGGVEPLYLLDGMPASVGHVKSIPITDIMFVDVLKGADATIYGGRAAGGVVAIYTKRGEDIVQKPKELSNFSNTTIPGFYKTREFYKPNYAIVKPEHKKPDYRKTLHWEPNIKFENKSSFKFDFYIGDVPNKYVIRIEGITDDGRPMSVLYNFNVQDED